ncbi:MAG: MBL fold metallo-hydrolase [Deltaproteobacteria bacterium]|nr:MBL fold metallo-hydrolase [Deltaproteobacteria bacterium]
MWKLWTASLVLVAVSVLPMEGVAQQEGEVTIRWYGHATFSVTSSTGLRVVIDPYGEIGYPLPVLEGDVVTISHEHRDHNNARLVKGNPVVLRGLTEGGKDWNRIEWSRGSVRIYSVPVYHDAELGAKRGKNSAFVYEMDGIRLAQLGDLGHILTEDQLRALGRVDVLMVPVGDGPFTIGGQEATRVVEQVRPRVVIPMHYKTEARPDWPGTDTGPFLQGKRNVRQLGGHTLKLSKAHLPRETEIVVMTYR